VWRAPTFDEQGVVEGERWCPYLPFFFYIVGKPSHITVFLVD
jgi:hypothetical protein